MQASVVLIAVLIATASGCRRFGPLPTFDELQESFPFVISGNFVEEPVFNLQCPSKPDSPPTFDFEERYTYYDDFIALNFDTNATAVIDVSCIHKGSVTCYTSSGYQVKSAGDAITEECLVYLHSVDTVTSRCGYRFGPSDEIVTIFMEKDDEVSEYAPNRECFESTYKAGFDSFLYQSMASEICAAKQQSECVELECADVVADTCCGKDHEMNDMMCTVDALGLNYEYKGVCGDGKQVLIPEGIEAATCYCT
eukprot:TRINITY_DN1061_c0_g1_i6.p1 TRINITY_DN1061_c0_g1~~TRINITY_DN1061_c0_g1_i6.p1  ORF type:complete len:253 (-),score=33.37 TRINITY_DN1061_c0_g1_i6:346-1104(-)